ncbi:MAG: type III pantothenate kinase [Anaerolineae bacterium]|nr:type III pantothenate kinase [Anaerolineae bacterium]
MLLTIDIGNSNVTLGLWDGQKWRLQWRLRTVRDKTADEYGIALKTLLREFGLSGAVDRVILASVVPTLTGTFLTLCERYLGLTAIQVRHDIPLGITVKTDNPAEVGADRLVNAAAAFHLYPGPSIVIDLGTATTFDVISGRGELVGVAIAPGPAVAADALVSRAARLSGVSLEAPPQAIGKNTVHAMQSGIVFGYVGLVEGLLKRLMAELNEPGIKVIGTGGLISIITPHTDMIDHVDPWLTLTGLRLISERQG